MVTDYKEFEKVALITGASRGIGKAIAIKLYSLGFNIAINAKSNKKLSESLYQELKTINKDVTYLDDHILYIQADISDKGARSHIQDEILKKFGRIDVLVNNAGIAPKIRTDILEATEESYDVVMNTNLKAPYFLTQSISKTMIKTIKLKKFTNYSPKIINISSISSFTSSTTRGEYCLSKAGISMMTKLYADRLADFGIQVFEIQPGIIKTDMTQPVKEKYDKLFAEGLTPINRWGVSEDIAEAVIAIVKDSFPYSTGQIFNIDGGFHLRRL